MSWIKREILEIKNHKKELSFLSVVIFLIIILRVPSIFEPYWYGDEGIYLTIGNALAQGETLYRDIHDNKPPFIYLLALGAGSQSVFRIYLFIWTIAGILLFWKLQRRIYTWQTVIPFTLVFGLFTSLPLIEGNIANGENFFLPLTVAGMFGTWQILNNYSQRVDKWALIAGLSFSFGTLFKIPAAFDGLAAAILIAWSAVSLPTQRKRLLVALFFLAFGFLAPWIVVSIIQWYQGAWHYFLNEVLLQNIGYLSTWNRLGTSSFGWLSIDKLTGRFFVAAFLTILILRFQKRLSPKILFSGLWFVWTIFGTTLSGRPYAHYFLQVVPPLVLLLNSLINKLKRFDLMAVGLSLVLLIIVIVKWQPWVYHVIPYYQNFANFVSGRSSKLQYLAYFDPATPKIYQLASVIQETTLPNENIFIWGDWPSVYALSRRIPVGRYTTAYHVADFDPTQEETIRALYLKKPRQGTLA
ncbi:MAG: hypothetical protein UW69_C0009G0005 [Microgenomates group bacterium GW2011_GWA2_44_7]|nr:MAG: hypothetical protein UW69_C0009G0005 [Microgenomates group bacterium GW2011_GWA2_44_7]